MGRYLRDRLLTGILSIFVLVSVTFFLIHIMPGSPFQTGGTSLQVIEMLNEEYGLNEPILNQYLTYLNNLVHGDLGISYQKPGVSVMDVISRAFPVTLSIGLPAIVLALFCGILIGIRQVVTKNTIVYKGIFAGTFLGMALPNFVIAAILMLIVGQELKWLPVAGLSSPAHYILPVISLAVYPTAFIARLAGNAYAGEMKKDYVTMARSKRLSDFKIAKNHILINILPPIINYMGIVAISLLTGSFVVESVFTIPGLGREFVLAVGNRDYTLIMGLTVFMGIAVIVITLLADICCALINPGIRHGSIIYERKRLQAP